MNTPLRAIKFPTCLLLVVGLLLLIVPNSVYGEGEERGASFFKGLGMFLRKALHVLDAIHIGKWVYDRAKEEREEEEKRKEAQRQWQEQLSRRNEEWDRQERERVRREYYQECVQREHEQARNECNQYGGISAWGCFFTKTVPSKCSY